VNRSRPEGEWLLLRTSTAGVTLAVFGNEGLLNERRRKAGQREHSGWEGHAVSAGRVKTFRKAGDVEKGAAGL
jgi:hypothetical protein